MNKNIAGLLGTGVLLAACLPGLAESGRGMNRKLYAVPPPGKVVIDGKLDDWDWSGAIESYELQESRDRQRAECAVMFDADALYLAAKIKDASPLLNRHNPAPHREARRRSS